jgi:dGTP triphosphohydrolase
MNDFAIVAAASLAHDIGTAFGHSGEKVIEYFPLETEKYQDKLSKNNGRI